MIGSNRLDVRHTDTHSRTVGLAPTVPTSRTEPAEAAALSPCKDPMPFGASGIAAMRPCPVCGVDLPRLPGDAHRSGEGSRPLDTGYTTALPRCGLFDHEPDADTERQGLDLDRVFEAVITRQANGGLSMAMRKWICRTFREGPGVPLIRDDSV